MHVAICNISVYSKNYNNINIFIYTCFSSTVLCKVAVLDLL